MGKELNKVEAVVEKAVDFTEAEIKRAQEVMTELARRAKVAEVDAAAKVKTDAIAAWDADVAAVKAWMKKGHDNPSRLAAELKVTVQRVEAILRKISQEIQAEKEKEFLKIPGVPN